MTDCTRTSVSGRSSSGLFSALETVCRETPASSATVASVGGVAGADRCAPASGASGRPGRLRAARGLAHASPPGLLIVPILDVTGSAEHVVPRICRSAHLACGHGESDREGPTTDLPLQRVRLGDRQVGGPLRRVPGLGHGRRACRADEPRPGRPGHRAGPPDRRGADRGLPGPHQRRARARPGARRRPGPRRRHPDRRRARGRQVHAAARGRRPDRARCATGCST